MTKNTDLVEVVEGWSLTEDEEEVLAAARAVRAGNDPNSQKSQANSGNEQKIVHLLPPSYNEIKGNEKQASGNRSEEIGIDEIPFDHHDSTPFNKYSDQYKANQVISKPTNETTNPSDIGTNPVKNGAMIPDENHAAAIVLAKSDKALSWTGFNSLINGDYSNSAEGVSRIELVEVVEG